MNVDLEPLREKWDREQPTYEALARSVRTILEDGARARGLVCDIKHRAKDVYKIIGKALRKGYEDPDREIRDRAGARVIVNYAAEVPEVERLIRDTFSVESHENKASTLEYNELGYLGVHFEITLREEQLEGERTRFRGLVCEVQVQTRAQNLWADVSHALSYKPAIEPPVAVRRGIYRLVALVEIFDEAVTYARDVILGMAGIAEVRMVQDLERSFRRFSARAFDRDLSMHVVGSLQELLSEDERGRFGEEIGAFLSDNQEKLSEIFEDYRQDTRNPFLGQPEALLIFRCIARDRFRLAGKWNTLFPPVLLERMAAIWGTPL